MKEQSILRLNVLGELPKNTRSQTLTLFATFGRAQAVSTLKLKPSQAKRLLGKIRDLRNFISEDDTPFDEPQLRQLGSELYRFILREDVGRLFDIASGNSEMRFLPLEILVQDNQIASWPWEYLFDPSTQSFICQDFHPISRNILTLYPGEVTPGRDKLHVLVIVGVLPNDAAATPPEDQVKAIANAFESRLGNDRLELTVMAGEADELGVKPEQLQMEIQGVKQYDVVHFYGHAAFDHERKEGYLILDHQSGNANRLWANEFANMLAGQDIRLVFLNACETAASAESEAPMRSSIAAALLVRRIPAVIATQFEMPANSADYFASLTYNALALGKPIGEAIRAGRQGMNYGPDAMFFDWGIPVLFTSDPNLQLFPPSEDSPGSSRPTPPWTPTFERALEDSNTIASLGSPETPNSPTVSVARNVQSQEEENRRIKVGLVDLDLGFGFLPNLVDAANRVQSYYGFQVAYLPVPSAAVRTDGEEQNASSSLFLPYLARYLRNAPQDLNVQLVLCLTSKTLVGGEDDNLYHNPLLTTLGSNKDVSVVSTVDVRQYAKQANVSFTKAVFYLCLKVLLRTSGGRLEFHGQTVGCPFDYCANPDDLIAGLRHMRFDHSYCRDKIDDQGWLQAIDELLALSVAPDASEEDAAVIKQHSGYDVYDPQGKKVGKVADLFVDEHNQPTYIGVTTESSPGDLALVPVDITTTDETREIVEVDAPKSRVESGPAITYPEGVTSGKQEHVIDYYGLLDAEPSNVREAQGPYYWSSTELAGERSSEWES